MRETDKWHELERRFFSIADPSGNLRADGTYIIGSGQSWSWFIKDLTPSIRRQFRATAELAGAFLNPESGDALTAWLEALRENRVNFSLENHAIEVNEDGTTARTLLMGSIFRLREASADFCCQLEAKTARDASSANTGHLRNDVATHDFSSRETAGDAKVATPESVLPRPRLRRGASPDTAARIEDYLTHYRMGLTEFARRCQTTEATIRKFRKTGRVRLDILKCIEHVLGSNPQDV